MSLKALLKSQATDAVVKSVTINGADYVFEGVSDGSILNDALLADQSETDRSAAHLSAVVGREVRASLIPKIMVVQSTLCHEDDPKERYDVADIAKLAAYSGTVFLQMVGPAFEVLGFGASGSNGILERFAEGESVAEGSKEP